MTHQVRPVVTRPKDITFRKVTNQTSHHVAFYDAEGDIATCPPGCHSDLLTNIDSSVMVIVDENTNLMAYNIPKENIVITKPTGTGPNGERLSKLVRRCGSANVTFCPSSEVKLSPPNVCHRPDRTYTV